MEEIWKPVVGLEGVNGYQASNLGRIKGPSGQVKTYFEERKRYLHIEVYSPTHYRNRKRVPVHRCVLYAFVGPPPEGHEADHIDRDTKNNCLDNLRWVTSQQNKWNTSATNKYRWKCVMSKTGGKSFRCKYNDNGTYRYTRTYRCPTAAALELDFLLDEKRGEFHAPQIGRPKGSLPEKIASRQIKSGDNLRR